MRGTRWARMSKGRRAAVMMTGVVLLILACAIVAQVQPPSDANSLGAPRKNIEDNNCYCHMNEASGKEASPKVKVTIDPASPDRMVTDGNATIMVSIQYEDAKAGTRYGFAVDLDSDDGMSLEGAALSSARGTPSENKTHLTQNEPMVENVFNITLTAPSKAQTVRLTVMGNAVNDDNTEQGDHWNTESKLVEIYKKREVNITTTVRNKGDVEAQAVNVSFYVDGDLIGVKYIPRIGAGEEENVSIMWDATFFEAGEYKVEVLLDSNSTNLELDEGNNRITKTIVLEVLGKEEGKAYDVQTILMYLIGVIIILVIIGIVYKVYR